MNFRSVDSPVNDPGHVLIKICGVTNAVDAEAAIASGTDAIGLNFHPGSARWLDPVSDLDWVRSLAGVVPRIGVMVNPARAQVEAPLAGGLIDAVQLHGDETPEFCGALAADGIPFAKALRVRDALDLANPGRFGTPWLLLDAFHPDAYGGTGRTLDWALAARFVEESAAAGRRIILSGGLTPENVAAAIRKVRPFGVDVASGVDAPGQRRRKDAGRMHDFCLAVREAFTKGSAA